MRRILTLLAGTLLAASIGWPTSAYAVTGTLHVSSSGELTASGCNVVAFYFDSGLPSEYYAHVNVVVTGPDGTIVTTVYPPGNSGNSSFTLCNPKSGKYQATLHSVGCNQDFTVCQDYAQTTTTFTLGGGSASEKTPTKTTLTASGSGTVRTLKITRLEEDDPGEFTAASGKVLLQQKVGSKWVVVKGSKKSTPSGHLTEHFGAPKHGALRLRAESVGNKDTTASYSKVITVR